MKTLPLAIGISVLLLLFWGVGNRLQAADERPSVIVIFTDDHGWPDLGAAGVYEDLVTPHLDALAASGVRATSGYVTAPQCVPSRGGLLVGRSQNRFGLESNAESLEGFDAQLTIAERLQKAGYATGQVGKWHLGPTNAIPEHGFNDVYSKNANRPCHANFTLAGETIEMQVVDDGLYHLDACSEAALAFIRRHADRPFFLYLAYRAPHVPLDAPKKYLDRFPGEMPERRRQALAMISAMDDGVGAIVAELKAQELTGDTLLFFIGDNGAPLKIHRHDAPGGGPGWDGSLNAPMNGEKGMLSEGGIRVPFLVAWPGRIPAGQVYDEPVSSLDVAATTAALAGIEAEPGAFDGVDLVPYLSGEKEGSPHEFLGWRWISQSAIRAGKWKLLRGDDREYLFDLQTDPGETSNLRDDEPEVADRMRRRLRDWTAELDPPGLATAPMSATWNAYFDFYLDGKPAPPPPGNAQEQGQDAAPGGWVVRNAGFTRGQGAFRVTPIRGKADKAPFLARTGLELEGPVELALEVKVAAPSRIGLAWRLEGQKDFPRGQSVQVEVKAGNAWQEMEALLPAEGKVIHMRVLLPPGESEIRGIALGRGEQQVSWDFSGR